MKQYITWFLAASAATTLAVGGIPLPDATLYGRVTIDSQAIGAGFPITVVAKVDVSPPGPSPGDSAGKVVGEYRMGSNPAASDNYVLKIKLESLADNSEPSDDAAVVGETVNLFVLDVTGIELFAGSFELSSFGSVVQRDLELDAPPQDVDGDGDSDLKDFAHIQRCFTGSSGVISPACLAADVTHDSHVDLLDAIVIAGRMGGPK